MKQARADQKRKANRKLQIQECSFVQWDVSSVFAIAASPCETLIAVARSDGNIELRRKDLVWAVSSLRYGRGSDGELTITAVCFSSCGRYIFVSRLDGSLTVFQVTPEGLQDHVELAPGGGAIWDIAVSRTGAKDYVRIAVACDDGCVRFIHADPNYLGATGVGSSSSTGLPTDSTHYIVHISERTNTRVLSVAWAPPSPSRNSDCVVCGDADGGVRWLNPVDGSLYGKGKIPSIRREKVMIWTLVFAHNGSDVICGDSRGMATVWASGTNTMSQEIRVEGLSGSLWSSTVVGEGTSSETIFFGSAGGGVGGLQSSAASSDDQLWVPLRGCRFHSHDVRSMSSFRNGTIMTGSVDARICLFNLTDFVERRKLQWILPYHGCAGQPPIQICRKGKLMISRRHRGVDVLSIPEKREAPELKLRMNLKSFKSNVVSCAVSSDSCHVAVSSSDTFRLYQVCDQGKTDESNGFGRVRRIDLKASVLYGLRGSVDLSFCGSAVVAITSSRQQVALYKDGELTLSSKTDIGSAAMFLDRITCCEGYAAVCDSRGWVFYAKVPNSTATKSCDLRWSPTHREDQKMTRSVSAMCFSPSASALAIAFSDFTVTIERIGRDDEAGYTLPNSFPSVITSLSFSSNEESLLVSGESFCAVVCASASSRKRKAGKETRKAGFEPYMLPFRDSLLRSSVVDTSRVVVVRRRWDLVQSSLPDAIPRKPFGT